MDTTKETLQAVEKTAKEIAKKRKDGVEEIDLNNPFTKKSKTKTKKAEAKKAPVADDKGEDEQKIAGYTPAEILKAPITTPTPDAPETQDDVKNPSVIFLFAVGATISLFGLILVFFLRIDVGIILALIGIVAVGLAVFMNFEK